MKEWTYMLKITHKDLTEAELDKFGQAGWELCNVERRTLPSIETGNRVTRLDYTFKREK
jgi:hypothetical protein